MFSLNKKNKIQTLERKTVIINNDIRLKELNIPSILTLISISSIFIISLRMLIFMGNI